jgi:hypothetical protein
MRLISLAPLINKAFKFVIKTSKQYNIDESHAVKHSLDIFHYTNKIYDNEVLLNPFLREQQDIIFVSSIVHDMCDKKYFFDEKIGLKNIEVYFKEDITKPKLDTILEIISTMSYSKVKKVGYPDLNEYQHAYHIVREADLLTAYDPDRCIMYRMHNQKMTYTESLDESIELLEKRVLQYRNDRLFVTNYSKNKSLQLHLQAIRNLNNIKNIRNKLKTNL